jgi:hypothetical protein
MDRKLLWKPSAMALVLVILLGLNWAACMMAKGRDPDGVWIQHTGVGKYYFFDDVLVPKELKYNASKSFIYETPPLSKTSSLVFSAWWIDVESLIDFFIYNMEKDGWMLVNSLQGKRSVLNFSKPEKACTIRIVDKWYGSLEVEVQVGPWK